MVKGRRRYNKVKNSVHVGAILTSKEDGKHNVSMKKEGKTDKSKKISCTEYRKEARVTSVICTTSTCRTTSLCAQVADIATLEVAKDEDYQLPCFYKNEDNSADVIKNIITDVGHFSTDETPVAAPHNGPPTPHRINMPSNQPDDVEDVNDTDVKPIKNALSLIQPITKKPAGRGRKRINQNTIVNHRLSDSLSSGDTNHKLTDYFPVRRSVRKPKKVVLEEKQRDLENKVLCQIEEGLEVRHFPGKGRGVITTREFIKGEFVVEYIGELIDQITAKKREKIYAQDHNTGCYMYYFQHRNQQYCVDATAETAKLGRLVNHCRNGNLITRVIEVESVPHLVLTAKENIPLGVEITYDYGERNREAIRHHPWLAL